MSEKVLFIGGTGNISLPCVAEAVSAGYDVTVFNRSVTSADLPPGVTSIAGDLKDPVAYDAFGKGGFDVVCQFITSRRRKSPRISPSSRAIQANTSSYRRRRFTRSRRAITSSPRRRLLGLQPEQDRL